jgi:hypothetical protein
MATSSAGVKTNRDASLTWSHLMELLSL